MPSSAHNCSQCQCWYLTTMTIRLWSLSDLPHLCHSLCVHPPTFPFLHLPCSVSAAAALSGVLIASRQIRPLQCNHPLGSISSTPQAHSPARAHTQMHLNKISHYQRLITELNIYIKGCDNHSIPPGHSHHLHSGSARGHLCSQSSQARKKKKKTGEISHQPSCCFFFLPLHSGLASHTGYKERHMDLEWPRFVTGGVHFERVTSVIRGLFKCVCFSKYVLYIKRNTALIYYQ